MSTLDLDDNSTFYFTTDHIKIPVNYEAIKTHSNLIKAIFEDDPDAREISIPHFKEYR